MDDELPSELRARRQAIYAQVTQRGRARRSRRIGAVAFAVAVVVATPVVAVALNRDGGDNPRVSTLEPSTTDSVSPTSQTVRSEKDKFTLANLTDRLTRAGHRVAFDGSTSGYPFAKTAHLLCVDGTQMRVFEYADIAARAAVSTGISADGSKLELPATGSATRTVIIEEWVGPPHFFASGRIIVLVLQDNDALLRDLRSILGPTISPHALRLDAHKSPCTNAAG
jgi:hypothetical protein